jgi:hypothetical protein
VGLLTLCFAILLLSTPCIVLPFKQNLVSVWENNLTLLTSARIANYYVFV